MGYSVKVTGARRFNGEYDGAEALDGAIEEAIAMRGRLAGVNEWAACVSVVTFVDDPRYPDGRVVYHWQAPLLTPDDVIAAHLAGEVLS